MPPTFRRRALRALSLVMPISLLIAASCAFAQAAQGGASAPSGGTATPSQSTQPSTQTASQVAQQARSVDLLRDTLVNLLQTLVDKGVLSRAQADQLVKQAQAQAGAEAAREAAAAKAEAGAVHVPYVPQIIQDRIAKQVAKQVQPAVTASVIKAAKAGKWNLFGAMPDWLSRVTPFGNLVVRGEADMFPSTNRPYTYLDFNAINEYGGLDYVPGADGFMDTTENRQRMRFQAHLGLTAALTPSLTAHVRLSAGTIDYAGSESQTFGNEGGRYPVEFDEADIRWDASKTSNFAGSSVDAGRILNPWFAPTQLIYANAVTFDGIAGTFRYDFGKGGLDEPYVFATVGGFPELEVPIAAENDKWLVGGQLGTGLQWGASGRQRLIFAGSYYNFVHFTGQMNAVDSTLLDYTAPVYTVCCNTMFNIVNSSTNPNEELFALASHFVLVEAAGRYTFAFPRYQLSITADAVKNIAYNLAQVEYLSGETFPSNENVGYVGEIGFGDPVLGRFGTWSAKIGYRYVKRDAVIDAWTNADFHGGGTNAEGYFMVGYFGVVPDVWVRLAYLAASQIDGPNYGLDIVQLDLNAQF